MQLLSVKEVSTLLQIKESTIRTWIRRKQIPPVCVFKVGHTVRIRLEKFSQWVNGDDCLQKA